MQGEPANIQQSCIFPEGRRQKPMIILQKQNSMMNQITIKIYHHVKSLPKH